MRVVVVGGVVAFASALVATALVWLTALLWGEVNLDWVLGYMLIAFWVGFLTGGVWWWRRPRRRRGWRP